MKHERTVKMIVISIVALGAILILGLLLQEQDNRERNRAIERCGGENNIVKKYTNQGDVYFQCKSEK